MVKITKEEFVRRYVESDNSIIKKYECYNFNKAGNWCEDCPFYIWKPAGSGKISAGLNVQFKCRENLKEYMIVKRNLDQW